MTYCNETTLDNDNTDFLAGLTLRQNDSKRLLFMKTKRTETVPIKNTITVPRDVYDKIEWLRKKDGRTQSGFIRKLLQEALEGYPDPDQPELPL